MNVGATASPRLLDIGARWDEIFTGPPDRAMIVSGDRKISVAECDRITSQIARTLIAQGAGKDTIVALSLKPRLDTVLAMIGVSRAGAAFCVVPPSYPQRRIEHIKKVINPVADITALDEVMGDAGAVSSAPRDPDCLAYVIFTSGTTGSPKAVEIEDRSLMYIVDQPDLYVGTGIAQMAALQFDACIWEIFGGLLNGMTVHLLEVESILDPQTASEALQGVDSMFVTTQLFNRLAQRVPSVFDLVSFIAFGGERVSPTHVGLVAGRTRIAHMYGPTEATVYATSYDVVPPIGEDVPLGSPLSGVQVLLCDQKGDLVPDGTDGEACIGGPGVMRGYRGDPEETAKVILLKDGQRFYRTGDIMRRRPDGLLYYVERCDRQTKVNGFRIDLGEIESVANQTPGVTGAVATVTDGKLSCYVTGDATVAAVRNTVRSELPEYSVPIIAWVPEIPLGPTGKTDVQELARLAHLTIARTHLYGAVTDVLGVTDPDPHKTFVELGGDSIAAMDVVWRLDKQGVMADVMSLLVDPLTEVRIDA